MSSSAGKTYQEALETEINGWVVTVVFDSGTWSAGPYDSKREAQNAAARMRRFYTKRPEYGHRVSGITVRPLWKDFILCD